MYNKVLKSILFEFKNSIASLDFLGKSNDDFEVELDKNLLTIKSNGSVSR